ncbi:UNVERIFIED_ORG: TetR/AcrR family transcriptional repressor of nem operon [Xanthobacter viscosus]|jgi:TetR/AcrR family transcriptional repressor of nem operon|uniref:TetR/AcrR family transcriptional regulator n=1 Tax=Xanthobacter autotrophicus TaxID=280 RepID=A0A6C1KIS7_XANAU|nr:TetR/AcrR family transcriptional regulator [Xanthobacter autotrophicus]TLX43721.1 TetR/AcrR family transcriptional regulator [Xanthobacter autotrophicus]
MARPRAFDENEVLDAAIRCFWMHGYEATSVRDLASSMGLTGASLYNAFGDKHALYERALKRYVDESVADRIRRLEDPVIAPRAAIGAFFDEIVERSLNDPDMKGCMVVNAAVELGPHDPELRAAAGRTLGEIEAFFRRRVAAGQKVGAISADQTAEDLAHMLLGVLLGIRVLARIRPERALLEGVLRPALAALEPR